MRNAEDKIYVRCLVIIAIILGVYLIGGGLALYLIAFFCAVSISAADGQALFSEFSENVIPEFNRILALDNADFISCIRETFLTKFPFGSIFLKTFGGLIDVDAEAIFETVGGREFDVGQFATDIVAVAFAGAIIYAVRKIGRLIENGNILISIGLFFVRVLASFLAFTIAVAVVEIIDMCTGPVGQIIAMATLFVVSFLIHAALLADKDGLLIFMKAPIKALLTITIGDAVESLLIMWVCFGLRGLYDHTRLLDAVLSITVTAIVFAVKSYIGHLRDKALMG